MRTFTVTILDRVEVHKLKDSWLLPDLQKLAAIIDLEEVDTYSPTELYDYLLMALQDLGHQKAGEAVLEAIFGDDMRPGQRQNLVDDLKDKEPWQDFSDVAQQPGIFNAVVIMYDAFTNLYPNPDAIHMKLQTSRQKSATTGALSDADLVRLLAAGMAENDILNRLYEDELKAGDFSLARNILWDREDDNTDSSAATIEVVSSRHWLGSLAKGDNYTASIP